MRVIYTDGACSGNPGPGGWAWAVAPDGAVHGSGGESPTTNQRMEVRAAFEALRANDGPVTIVSDSTYVVNCFRNKWYVKWRANGWKNSQKQPVANRDLWEPFVELVLARTPPVQWQWVKGHSGDRLNDLVDRLAVAAAASAVTVRSPAAAAGAAPALAAPEPADASPEPADASPEPAEVTTHLRLFD